MSEIVVATLKRYNITPGGKVDKSFSKVEREGMKVEQSYVDLINNQTKQHGLFFEVDKKATEQWVKDFESNQEAMREKENIKKALAANVIKEAAEVSLETVKKQVKKGRPPKKSVDAE